MKEKIERIQRRATKLVRNIKNRNYEERLTFMKIMSLEQRRDRGDMIMTYNILNAIINPLR